MTNLFMQLYTTISNVVFGGMAVFESGNYLDLVTTLVSTCAILALLSLPFVIVFGIVRRFF